MSENAQKLTHLRRFSEQKTSCYSTANRKLCCTVRCTAPVLSTPASHSINLSAAPPTPLRLPPCLTQHCASYYASDHAESLTAPTSAPPTISILPVRLYPHCTSYSTAHRDLHRTSPRTEARNQTIFSPCPFV
eukprot:IDg6696t1